MEITVETHVAHGEASSARLRVRLLPGQGVDMSLRVELAMRCVTNMQRVRSSAWSSSEFTGKVHRFCTPSPQSHYNE
ncbi:hypothetical protein [Paraburkholderia sp. BR13444]|uniref:hypothetical protein n=1 Tax=Paraburkholderia sp. BR13444 TaxID=3236997 RepID=UPI0034CD033B